MCELYPRLNSCCGIPTRIALIFIAVLSIVTGALMNQALKKAGVNIASIKDIGTLKNLSNEIFGTTTKSSWSPGVPGDPSNPWGPRPPGGSGGPGGRPYKRAEDESQDVRSATKTPEMDYDDDAKSTIEIIGEDVEVTEAVRFEYDTGEDTGKNGTKNGTTTTTTTTKPTTTKSVITTTTQEPVFRFMGVMNRNCLNFQALFFIGLGILLFVANFMNSPDMMLLYVILCIANCVAGLLLLFSVVAECAQDKNLCLLNRLDWFSSMGVMIIWFFYVFAWAFFASVANGFANEATGRELPP